MPVTSLISSMLKHRWVDVAGWANVPLSHAPNFGVVEFAPATAHRHQASHPTRARKAVCLGPDVSTDSCNFDYCYLCLMRTDTHGDVGCKVAYASAANSILAIPPYSSSILSA